MFMVLFLDFLAHWRRLLLLCREKDVAAREAVLREQQAEVARQEEEVTALKQQLLQQQQEVERARSQLNQQRSTLEAAQAQVGQSAGHARWHLFSVSLPGRFNPKQLPVGGRGHAGGKACQRASGQAVGN